MKPGLSSKARRERGYALLTTIVFGAITLAILAGAMNWSANNLRLNSRSNQYFRTVAAAEAATEAVRARLWNDYLSGGDALIQSRLSSYRAVVPTSTDSSYWGGYTFGNNLGQTGQTQVVFVPPVEYRELASQYRGLKGYASTYQIVSLARDHGGYFDITAGVRQEVEPSTIPLFQFAIFYNMDLEINPGPDMTITGPVHSNGTIYSQPQKTLTFENEVTSVGDIVHDKMPLDPTGRTFGRIDYEGNPQKTTHVPRVNLPIGTNNTPAAVRQVVEIPPAGESASSPMGKQRYYNQADLVIIVTDTGVKATSGAINNFATKLPAADVSKFVNTSVSFFNKRENDTVNATQVDVAKLRQYNATNALLRPILPFGDIRILYVVDQRSQSAGTQAGVRLVNGETLPPAGLTVATPNPLYVLGHYNAPLSARGTANTSSTLPASLVADAITVLSPNWKDSYSSKSLDQRQASDTTVNAAFLAGIVPTQSGSYSGGVENFPRFLEDWSGDTFTYNGSMVVMYESKYAVGPWRGTGGSLGIYNPPTRNWSFDTNFRDPSKIPPGTPSVRTAPRTSWATFRPAVPLP